MTQFWHIHKQSYMISDINMEVTSGTSQTYNKKTKKDEHGQYPVWMNQRAIHKQRKKNINAKKGKKSQKW